jgi:hypothetical protein
MVMKIQVMVIWLMTLCSDVVGYLYFGGPCCFLLYDKVNGAGKGALDIGRDDKTD